ncbi:MAG: hypothetical protein AAB779_00075 [Patescibacteria group bacterium]
MEAEQKYLTLSEAAPLTPYSSSYLSFLARKGKLRSIKEGDTWLTTREWVLDYMGFVGERGVKEKTMPAESGSGGYITSAQAERIFPYSSSYFSLRIRQGKLKGEKIDGKWHTTAAWINQYMAEFGEKEKPAKFIDFSFLRPLAIGLTVFTVLVFAGPPKLMARWVYQPLATAYRQTTNIISSGFGLIDLENKGQVAGEMVKFKQ